MFTGLVEAIGEVIENRAAGGGRRLRIATELSRQLEAGDSLAVNGVCLTTIVAADDEVHAEVGPETLRITTLGGLARGTMVNLERPLRADGRFGGHLVVGHVDAVGRIEGVREDSSFRWLTIGHPSELAPFIIAKGSIAVDGISLTVAALGRDRFDIMVIPYTIEHTNLKTARAGDPVNLECDLVGKYVVRAAELAGLPLMAGGGDRRS